ncbi:LexA family protein [Enterococcus avium]|uniref:LexA family protein n=1 Tax=Enterococcus avium TaxID=33945 RepID=UPI0032E494A7
MRKNSEIADLIEKYRKTRKMSQDELGKKLGVNRSTISRYASHEIPFPENKIITAAKALDVDYSFLIGEDLITATGRTMVKPLIGRIVAGRPLETYEIPEEVEIPFNIGMKHPNSKLLEITGNSMNKLFPDGQYVLIDPEEEVYNGDVAAVRLNCTEYTVKRFYKLKSGVVLEPDSYDESQHSIMITNPIELEEVYIEGKVVWDMANPSKRKY